MVVWWLARITAICLAWQREELWNHSREQTRKHEIDLWKSVKENTGSNIAGHTFYSVLIISKGPISSHESPGIQGFLFIPTHRGFRILLKGILAVLRRGSGSSPASSQHLNYVLNWQPFSWQANHLQTWSASAHAGIEYTVFWIKDNIQFVHKKLILIFVWDLCYVCMNTVSITMRDWAD